MPFTLLSSSAISGGVGDSLRPDAQSLVFNGNMAISQRGTSFTGKTGVDYYACDRWRTFISSLGTHTITQEDSSNPTGFGKSYKILTTTANASPSGTNYLYLRQSLEGNDVQLLKYGTSDAVKLTAGFWVKSNKTGTFGVETQCLSGGTSYERTEDITINSADTWEFKTFVVPANTSNAIDDGNGQSYNFYFWINAGTDYIGTPHANWGNQSNAGRAGTSTLGVGESTNDYFQLTGVQFEVGEYTSSTIPPFQHESYGDNLVRCHRYFLYTGGGSAYQHHGSGVEVSSTAAYMTTPLSCPFRASPSITANNTSGGIVIYDGNTESAVTSVGTTNYSTNTSIVNVAVNASGGGIDDGNGITVYSNANSNAGFLFDAEL